MAIKWPGIAVYNRFNMFNLEKFKNFARVTTQDDDDLIVELGQSATDVIQGQLGLDPIAPLNAVGVARIVRNQGNANIINVPDTQKFIYTPFGVAFIVNSAGTQESDKAEQDFPVTAENTGSEANHIPTGSALTAEPEIADVTITLLAAAGGKGKYDNLPDTARVRHALNLLTLHYYESRGFIKADSNKAVLMMINNLIARDRDDVQFTGGPDSET